MHKGRLDLDVILRDHRRHRAFRLGNRRVRPKGIQPGNARCLDRLDHDAFYSTQARPLASHLRNGKEPGLKPPEPADDHAEEAFHQDLRLSDERL